MTTHTDAVNEIRNQYEHAERLRQIYAEQLDNLVSRSNTIEYAPDLIKLSIYDVAKSIRVYADRAMAYSSMIDTMEKRS